MTNDQIIQELIRCGHLFVNLDTGFAYSRFSNDPAKPLGAKTRKGYLRTCINYQERSYYFLIHRIIWIAKNGTPVENMFIDHVDTVKTHNWISNLELVTNEENMARSAKSGMRKGIGRKSTVRNEKGQFITKEQETWRKALAIF